jgi:hypothetical protein
MSNLLTTDHVRHMINMQRVHNTEVAGSSWPTRSLQFSTAAVRDLGEALSILEQRWAWWEKKKEPVGAMTKAWDKAVDAFHHSLSENMQEELSKIAEAVNSWYELAQKGAESIGFDPQSKASDAIVDAIAQIASDAGTYKTYASYGVLCAVFGRKPEDIYKGYLGKNALNQFRVAHGYNEGTYTKYWCDVEDTLVMYSIADTLPANSDLFKNTYDELEKQYEDNRQVDHSLLSL